MRRERSIQYDRRRGLYSVFITHSGVRRYFNLGENRLEARKRLKDIERDIAAGRIVFAEHETSTVIRHDGTKDIRIEELAVKHLEWVKANRAANTFLLRQHYVSSFVQFVGPCMVSSITRDKVEKFLIWIRGKSGRPTTGSHAIREIKTLLMWAEDLEVCPCPLKRWPQIKQSPPVTRRFPPEEFRKLLSVVPEDFRDLLVFGTLTGLRPQELRQLRHANVIGSGQRFIHIEHHKTSASSKVPRPRTVPLSQPADAIIRQQIALHPKAEFIFLNGDGTPYTMTALRIRLHRWCLRAGITAFCLAPFGCLLLRLSRHLLQPFLGFLRSDPPDRKHLALGRIPERQGAGLAFLHVHGLIRYPDQLGKLGLRQPEPFP